MKIRENKVQLHRSFGTCPFNLATQEKMIQLHRSFGTCHCQCRDVYSQIWQEIIVCEETILKLRRKRFSCIVPSEHVTVNVVTVIVKFDKKL